jgi:hypothetical protein
MATLTIYFVGICSHLRPDSPESTDPHRAVLVNAREGHPPRGIQPHHPRLLVRSEDIITGTIPPLTGVTITVRDRDAKPNYSEEFGRCIPHLMSYTQELVEVNPDVTVERNPARTAGFIDVHGGIWNAGVDEKGAAVAYVKIQTDTEDVALNIKPFDDSMVHDLVLKDNAEIQVENTGRSFGDHDHDFLLHFLIMNRIPADARWPEQGDLTCQALPRPLPWDGGTIGPGCSNSNYP